MKILILAGGNGVRLWPLSTAEFPKQFISITDPESLLQQTVLRFLQIAKPQDIYIVSGKQYLSLLKEQLTSIHPLLEHQIILEPHPRNTFAAIVWSLYNLKIRQKLSKQEPIVIAPSDHYLPHSNSLLDAIQSHYSIVEQGTLMLYGVVPSYPETGYGYIQPAQQLDSTTYQVASFIEKPSLEKAKEYVSKGYFWNSGMFFLSLSFLENALQSINPQLLALIHNNTLQFDQIPKQSFDYYIVEKAKKIYVSPLETTWSDVGSWDGVFQIMPKDGNQNVFTPNQRAIDCKRCFIHSHHRRITAVDLSDIMIIDTKEELLVLPRGHSQKVKEVIPSTSDRTEVSQAQKIRIPPQSKVHIQSKNNWSIFASMEHPAFINHQEVFREQTYLLSPQKEAVLENHHHEVIEIDQLPLEESSAKSAFATKQQQKPSLETIGSS